MFNNEILGGFIQIIKDMYIDVIILHSKIFHKNCAILQVKMNL